MDVLSKRPELLDNENVCNLIKNGSRELLYDASSRFLNTIGYFKYNFKYNKNSDYTLDILNLPEENDINKWAHYYSQEYLHGCIQPQLEFLLMVPKLKNVFNNKVFLNRFDELLNNVARNNVGYLKILEKVNNSEAILENDTKMNELITLLIKSKPYPDKSAKVQDFLDKNL